MTKIEEVMLYAAECNIYDEISKLIPYVEHVLYETNSGYNSTDTFSDFKGIWSTHNYINMPCNSEIVLELKYAYCLKIRISDDNWLSGKISNVSELYSLDYNEITIDDYLNIHKLEEFLT